MTGLLSSRRKRRRAGWTGGLVVAAAVLTFVGIHWSNTGRSSASPFRNEPVQTVAASPDSIAFAGAERDQVRQVAAEFVATAVAREHLDRSWDIVTPSFRQGLTRTHWLSGDIPVVPY